MSSSSQHPDPATSITFDGSNWEDLARLVTQARMTRLTNSDIDDDSSMGAWLALRLRGAAADWFGKEYASDATMLLGFNAWIERMRQHFGVSDDGLRARRRGQLEGLAWQADLPLFFAEYDRLTSLLGVNDSAAKIAMLRGKLPVHVQKLLAEQALDFADYGTMRERLLTMWALDPAKNTAVRSSGAKKPKCGRCGKKGHAASDCRSAKN